MGEAPPDDPKTVPSIVGRRDNNHLLTVEFEPGYGARWIKLQHPDGGCEPGNCECGRDLSMSLAQHQEENYTAEEVADWAGERPLGTCYDCEDLTEPRDTCWVEGWFDNLSADDCLSGTMQIEARPIYDDESLIMEMVRARVPGEGTHPEDAPKFPSIWGELHCPACGEATIEYAPGGSLLCHNPVCPQQNALHMLLADEHTKDHLVEIGESTFSVQHPIVERLQGALFKCPLHTWLTAQPGPPGPEGRYWVTEKDGAALGEVHYAFERVE